MINEARELQQFDDTRVEFAELLHFCFRQLLMLFDGRVLHNVLKHIQQQFDALV